MGGNVKFGELVPEPIDLRKHCKSDVVREIDQLCREFEVEPTKWKIYPSGSTIHLYDETIIPQELLRFKPSFGDVDLQIPHFMKNNIAEMLTNIRRVGNWVYLGHKKSSGQVITLWYNELLRQNVQVDFEFIEYHFENPTAGPSDWSKFSRNSDWGDTRVGIKGVFHKYLLRALTSLSVCELGVLSENGSVDLVRTNTLAFSVTRGLRQKYRCVSPGLFSKLSPKDSVYVTNPKEIFSSLFQCCPGDDSMRMFRSFIGSCHLMKTFLNKDEQMLVASGYDRILFGSGAQILYRDDPIRDQQEKRITLTYMKQVLGIE